MTPNQVKIRRLELGLTVDELAFALDLPVSELRLVESGDSDLCRQKRFEEAFDLFEERVFGTFVGA